jgi:hypothetical protein
MLRLQGFSYASLFGALIIVKILAMLNVPEL